MRIFALEPDQTNLGDVLLCDSLAFGGRNAAQLESEGHIAYHIRPRQQGEILKHEGTLRSRTIHRPAVYKNRPGGGPDQAGDDLQ